jgi:hypothetical protein
MHRGHDHYHHHDGGGGEAGIGHNHGTEPTRPAQWQTPHRPDAGQADPKGREPDLDLVEEAFANGFGAAADPTSFLRLARIPFEATTGEGRRLVLLRIETDAIVDVGSVMPHLGGASFRYDPLPAAMVSQRRRLRFVYFDGEDLHAFSFAQACAFAAA